MAAARDALLLTEVSGRDSRVDSMLSAASTAACSEDGKQEEGLAAPAAASAAGLPDGGGPPMEFRIRYERDIEKAVRMAWARLFAVAAGALACAELLQLACRSTSYITYMLMFLLVAPAGVFFKEMFRQLAELDREHCCVVMTLCANSRRERHLMEALLWQLSKTEGLANRSEAVVERMEDPSGSGAASYEVELRPSRKHVALTLERGPRCETLLVKLEGCGDGGVPGKAELLVRCVPPVSFFAGLVRRGPFIRAMADAQDSTREFLHRWLKHIHADYMRTNQGVIEVYELTRNKADDPLAWTRVRQERSVTSSGEGMWHYASSDWSSQLKKRAEYAIRHRGKTRVSLFLSGPKGSGKTLFVEWLAGELSLPLYSVDLSSPQVTNEVLREVITPNKMVHNLPVIFHFDEFQTMIEEWADARSSAAAAPPRGSLGALKLTERGAPRTAVTIQGLQCMLEGASTPNNAIFVFTSSKPLPELHEFGEGAHEWRGLLRRFPVQAKIPAMSRCDRLGYCKHFLAAYLPQPWDVSCPRELARWTAFEEAWMTSKDGVPFDMLAKYAQERTHAAYIAGLMTSLPEGCKVQEECRERYLDAFFEPRHVRMWIGEYAGNAGGCIAGSVVGK